MVGGPLKSDVDNEPLPTMKWKGVGIFLFFPFFDLHFQSFDTTTHYLA